MTNRGKGNDFTRREAGGLLAIGAAGMLLGGCAEESGEGPAARPPDRLSDDLVSSSVIALAAAIRDRRISSEEMTRVYLDRIEAVNGPLNAVVLLRADDAIADARRRDEALARGEAMGPLHGVPMTLKDSINTADMVTTGGTLGRKDYLPGKNATVAARLIAAGAVLMGKTNTPEFTMSFETGNLVYGETRNPYDNSRSPGGSSGGAGAAIAAAMTPFDIGSDTGGSIRVPAHFNGVAGIKPTTGRVPRTGHVVDFRGVHQAKTQLGPMARYVDDLDLLLRIISGPDDRDPFIYPVPLGEPATVDLKGLRMAWHSDNGLFEPDPETQATVAAAVSALTQAGAVASEVVPGPVGEVGEDIWVLGADEQDGHAWMDRLLAAAGTEETHEFIDWTRDRSFTMTSGDFTALLERRDLFRSDMLAFMADYDIIVSPVAGFPALPYGEGASLDALMGFSYSHIHNLTGWPGAVVRCGTSPQGLPIGVLITARPWAEHVALAVAGHLEQVFGGWRMPGT